MGFFSRKKQTIGYKVRLGVHAILCHGPIDKLTRITFGDKVAWSGESTGGRIGINKPKLFGGEDSEGGVSGSIDLEMGDDAQGRNDYLQGQLGTDIPAFRGVVGLVFRHFYFGMGKYLKRFAFRGVRIQTLTDGSQQWYSAKADVGGDLNPAHLIRECLTNDEWGMGYSAATDVDDASFTAAADTLYSEGMGISLLWDRSIEIREFLEGVIKHIDGALYVDPKTGKFTLDLVRDDFVVADLPAFDQSSVVRVANFKRRTIDELTNSVTVKYWDKSTGKDGSVSVQNIALAARQEAVIGASRDYPGFTNATIAAKVAMRDLKALSNPLASADLYLDRSASSLRPGGAFVLSYPRYGVDQLVMRVLDIEFGKLDSGQIRVKAAEDVFSLGDAVYSPPPASEWQAPDLTALPSPHRVFREATYWEILQALGQSTLDGMPATSGMTVVAGTKDGLAVSADLYTDPNGSGYELAESMDFTPTATISAAPGHSGTDIEISGGESLESVTAGTIAEIGGEIVLVQSVTDTTATVVRAVIDTLPIAHQPGDRIYFSGEFYASDEVEYSGGSTAKAKIITITGEDELSLASAPEDTVSIAGRHYAPYPPGAVAFNGSSFPSAVVGDVVVDWRHRDRAGQGGALVGFFEAADYGPEAGTTYTVELYNAVTEALIDSQSGLTGKTATFLEQDELNATGTVAAAIRVEVYAVRDATESPRVIWSMSRVPTLISLGANAAYEPLGSGIFDGTTGIDVSE